ncbi:MAG: glycosyltransferase family 4 protein [Proteobacteria bacterium]|nr:glycosyltransferase family 4 protein [Pseudomonadota bacterium]
MKIAYVVETLTNGLGYIDNVLPPELAKLGAEVHVLTCRLPPYYARSAAHFGVMLNTQIEPNEVVCEGVTIHTLKFRFIGRRVVMRGLCKKLREIQPDAVIVRGISSIVLGQVIFIKLVLGFRLVTSTGQSYSAVPVSIRKCRKYSLAGVKSYWSRYIMGRLFSLFVTKCVPSVDDGGEALVEFYGVPRSKLQTIPLGVDTRRFFPVGDAASIDERARVRSNLNIENDEIVVIWTGRMEMSKGIDLLAAAVQSLFEKGWSIRCVFVGDGPAAVTLSGYSRAIHVPFMPWIELPAYYRAADIAVWPHGITTSTLDASACGLPVIMSDTEKAKERWQGIGMVYDDGNVESLMAAIFSFCDDRHRHNVGARGSTLMRERYSWPNIARQFLAVLSQGDVIQ